MHLPSTKEFCSKLDRILDIAIEKGSFDDSDALVSQTSAILSDFDAILSGEIVSDAITPTHNLTAADKERIENLAGAAVHILGEKKLRAMVISPANLSVLRKAVVKSLYDKPEASLDSDETERLSLFWNILISRLREESFKQNARYNIDLSDIAVK